MRYKLTKFVCFHYSDKLTVEKHHDRARPAVSSHTPILRSRLFSFEDSELPSTDCFSYGANCRSTIITHTYFGLAETVNKYRGAAWYNGRPKVVWWWWWAEFSSGMKQSGCASFHYEWCKS